MNWISVNDRLPELNEIQLASASPYKSAKDSKYVLVYRDIENWDEDERVQKAMLRQINDGIPTWTCGSGVTFWMPLPESPEKSSFAQKLIDLLAQLKCKEGHRKFETSKTKPLCYQCGQRHDLILEAKEKFGIELTKIEQ